MIKAKVERKNSLPSMFSNSDQESDIEGVPQPPIRLSSHS